MSTISNISYRELQELLELCKASNLANEQIVFIEENFYPGEDWVKKAEDKLGVNFPPSYNWFLKKYGEGTICGDELYCVYKCDITGKGPSDIVYNTITDRDNGFLNQNEVALLHTSLGEDFIWRTDEADEDGEYPVYLQLGDHREYYAPNYIAFLIKYIKSCLEEE